MLEVETPSICTSSSDLTRLDASCSFAPPRCPASESISSMKMVDGAWKRAISKRRRTIFSESPRHLEARVDEVSEKKDVPHSVATALASRVLPVPGGPNMSTPFHVRQMGGGGGGTVREGRRNRHGQRG